MRINNDKKLPKNQSINYSILVGLKLAGGNHAGKPIEPQSNIANSENLLTG